MAKVGYFMGMFLVHVVGTLLMGGIVVFETFGGDSQKRNIMNLLLTVLLMVIIVNNILIGSCRVWRDLVGLVNGDVMRVFIALSHIFTINWFLLYDEMTLFHYLYVVIWKRIRVLDDKFWLHVLVMTNFLVSSVIVVMVNLAGLPMNHIWLRELSTLTDILRAEDER